MSCVSYREENGQVVLTMSREDYGRIRTLLGMAAAETVRHEGRSLFTLDQILALTNRLNFGNPNYTPYQVEEKKP